MQRLRDVDTVLADTVLEELGLEELGSEKQSPEWDPKESIMPVHKYAKRNAARKETHGSRTVNRRVAKKGGFRNRQRKKMQW